MNDAGKLRIVIIGSPYVKVFGCQDRWAGIFRNVDVHPVEGYYESLVRDLCSDVGAGFAKGANNLGAFNYLGSKEPWTFNTEVANVM